MRTYLKDVAADEKTTPVFTATIEDETGFAIPLSQITTITLTLYNVDSGTILNGRSSQDVKNANNVTIGQTDGLLTWNLQPADTAIEDSAKALELRIALFEWTWQLGAKNGKHEIAFYVRNLGKIT